MTAAGSELLDELLRFWLASAKRQLSNSIMTIVLKKIHNGHLVIEKREAKRKCEGKEKRKVLYWFQMNIIC